ncbi:MAG: protein kinase [Kofleriaceae bacterium]
MTGCPDLDSLETVPLADAVRAHVASCSQCKLVVEVFDEGELRDCERFDALLAARGDGSLNAAGQNLLDRHLASCESCRAVAETLSPTQDMHGDLQTLPQVDPAGYALGLEVARGGMGRIIAARDLRVGRPVAVKELLGRSPHLAARFEREARVTARLQHPGIVPIYEIGRWPDGTPFYSMRMVDGRTLLAAIERATTLPARLALLPAVIAACEAVAFAHGQRVIHRDLTPSNVLVGAYGETVVIDWGLAKDLSRGASDEDDPLGDPYRGETAEGLTGAGAIVGTLAYMPPEQANAQPVDERSDVYALGAILYHLLAGAPPHRTRTTAELLELVRTGASPPAIDKVAPRSPRDLVSIVTKAMSRSPVARYPSARELAEELVRFQTGRMVEAHQYSRREKLKRFVRRNRPAVTVTVAAALLLGTVSALYVSRIVRSGDQARDTARELVFERGRTELLAGNTLRALAYLWDSYQNGLRGAAIEFLLGNALSELDASEHTFNCGSDVRELAFSPSSGSIAAACSDRVKIWRLDDGSLTAELAGESGDFDNVEYSHDGKILVTWGSRGKVRILDAATGAARIVADHRPAGSTDHFDITFATFTPGDDRVATTGDDGFARVWDVATGAQLVEIEVSSSRLYRRVWGKLSHDGSRVLTTTIDGSSAAWDTTTGTLERRFEFGGFVTGGEQSRAGTHVVQCGLDGRVQLRDARSGGELERDFTAHTGVVWKCIFSPDETRILTTSHDGTAKQWEVATGKLLHTVTHGDVVWRGQYSPDGRELLTLGIGGQLKLWDARSGIAIATYETHHGRGALFSPDNKWIAAMRGDGRVQIWVRGKNRRSTFDPDTTILGASEDGSLAFTSTGDGFAIAVWRDRERLPVQAAIESPFATAADRIVAQSGDGVVVLDAHTGRTLQTIAIGERVYKLELSGDAHRLVASTNRASTVFDVATGARVLELPDATHALLDRGGTRAIAWREDLPPELWNVDTRTREFVLPAIDATAVGFSGDGASVALIERANQPSHGVSLWRTSTGVPLMQRSGDVAVFDPSGRWLTTIGDGVTTFDASDGSVHASFAADVGAVRELVRAQASPDGSLVAAVGDYGRAVLVMNASDGRVLQRWDVPHDPPAVTERGFEPPNTLAWWTGDGRAVVGMSKSVTVWKATNPPADAMARLVRKNVPWRVVGGRLQLVQDARLARRVVKNGVALANQRVVVRISTPAEVGSAPINWETTRAKLLERSLVTSDDGSFELEGLVPGEYTVELVVNNQRYTPSAETTVEPGVSDLEITR